MKYTNSELAALSDEALVHAELQLDRETVALRFRKSAEQLRDVNLIKQARRNIARIRTEQRRRELANGLAKDSLRETHRGSFKAQAVASTEGSSFASDLNEQMEDGE
jgi:large subunit ribosomal protein L29